MKIANGWKKRSANVQKMKKLLFTKTFQIIFKVVLNGKTNKYWKRRVKKRNQIKKAESFLTLLGETESALFSRFNFSHFTMHVLTIRVWEEGELAINCPQNFTLFSPFWDV